MKLFILSIMTALLVNSGKAQDKNIFVRDVSEPVISLSGKWKICLKPPENFHDNIKLDDNWKDIHVPGECMMQGFPIKHDIPFVYKSEIKIPVDYMGKTIKIRFEGVYCYARVWINGKYLRDHSGGFTAWECDITSAVEPGKTAILTVEVTDRADEISYASGYAKHQIGGILRNVSLIALPFSYPEQIDIQTDFDKEYENANLILSGKIINAEKNSKIILELFNNSGQKMNLNSSEGLISENSFRITNSINNPAKWDAEHPNLYHLKLSFIQNGEAVWQKNYNFGFRKIEIKGNKFLINGREIKLRGACRHDIHPQLGRVSTPEYDLKDVLLAKEANINFIRTSHYPPSDYFLQLCDQYGIYVEDETAVCFVGSHRTADYYPGSSENSMEFTERYLSQLKEMVDNHRNHPSVILWSIGNENNFGMNFKKSYDWVKSNDISRPVIFSYPGKVPDSLKSYDIISMHYPGTEGNMDQYGKIIKSFGHKAMPVIFDEWAHVACYNSVTVREDPNIREFWGMSLDTMWEKTFEAEGGLGGAIWGMIDETFMLPKDIPGFNEWWGKIDKNVIPGEYSGKTIGYGEWGIIDTWRRKKPEFWNVKKAYSPVRILKTEYDDFIDFVNIPVYNRYDFTNLKELNIEYTFKGQKHNLKSADIPAHSKGILNIPLKEWPSGEVLSINFFDISGNLIDNYNLHRIENNPATTAIIPKGSINIKEDESDYIIICDQGVNIYINKMTGLFRRIRNSNINVEFSGPYLNLRTRGQEIIYSSHRMKDYGINWKLSRLSVQKIKDHAECTVTGDYEEFKGFEFKIEIFPDASFIIIYKANNIPKECIREIGIKFIFDDIFDSLSWKRKTYWGAYPPDHLSAPEGNVLLYSGKQKIYREPPGKDWQEDSKSFFYNGTDNEMPGELTNIAKATKENIYEYKLQSGKYGNFFVKGNAEAGCRIDKKESKINLYTNNKLDYPDLSWGNYQRDIIISGEYAGKVHYKIQLKDSKTKN